MLESRSPGSPTTVDLPSPGGTTQDKVGRQRSQALIAQSRRQLTPAASRVNRSAARSAPKRPMSTARGANCERTIRTRGVSTTATNSETALSPTLELAHSSRSSSRGSVSTRATGSESFPPLANPFPLPTAGAKFPPPFTSLSVCPFHQPLNRHSRSFNFPHSPSRRTRSLSFLALCQRVCVSSFSPSFKQTNPVDRSKTGLSTLRLHSSLLSSFVVRL